MPYQIEFREDINTLISNITSGTPTEEDLKLYIDQIVHFQKIAIQNRSPRFYHIIIIEQSHYSLADGLNIIRVVQQHKGLKLTRKQLNMTIIVVGQTSKSLQIMITMMTNNVAGKRHVAIFPTLDAALAFVHKNNASLRENRPLE